MVRNFKLHNGELALTVSLACETAGHVRGEKSAMIAHILGGKSPCEHVSVEATTVATALKNVQASSEKSAPKRTGSAASLPDSQAGKKMKQTTMSSHVFKGNNIPFSKPEVVAIQAQALRAVISANLPFQVFEDIEMLKLFEMMCCQAPAIMPSAKVVGGRLLDQASSLMESNLDVILRAAIVGLVADGWKAITKSGINGICTNINYKVRTQFIQLVMMLTDI